MSVPWWQETGKALLEKGQLRHREIPSTLVGEGLLTLTALGDIDPAVRTVMTLDYLNFILLMGSAGLILSTVCYCKLGAGISMKTIRQGS